MSRPYAKGIILTSPSPGKCRSCSADILWATTEAGKTIPLDVKPAPGLFSVDERGVARSAKVYVSHFATCPNAQKHRKPAAATASPAPTPEAAPSAPVPTIAGVPVGTATLPVGATTTRAMVASLGSRLCPACAGEKKCRQTFCSACYYKLPEELRRSLYAQVGQGYERAVESAMIHLCRDRFCVSAAIAKGEANAR